MKIIKITGLQRLLLSLGLVGSIIALAFLPAAHHVSYIRYTSPPLPDGTRYTFLRPTYLTEVVVEANNAQIGKSGSLIQFISIYPHTSFLEDLMLRRLRMPFFSHGNEEVSVGVNSAAKGNYSSKLTEEQGVQGAWTYHNVYVNDEKAGLSFCLQHSAGIPLGHPIDVRSLAVFERSDATITRSFRILPPRVAAPNP